MMIEIELPYPPSVNHYWLRHGKRTFIGPNGRRFRRAVALALLSLGRKPIRGKVEIWISVYPPDRRRRDLDNILKALLDALEHGGAYRDDSQIVGLHVERGKIVEYGKVSVTLTERWWK